jgi:hypothetical protein
VTRSYEWRFARHLGALTAYVAREGHTNVPYAHRERCADDEVALGRWVAYVRSRARAGRLAPDQAAQLEAVPGWHWQRRRPGPAPQHARNAEIRELRAASISLGVIADTYGLSKQRIFQITRPTS